MHINPHSKWLSQKNLVKQIIKYILFYKDDRKFQSASHDVTTTGPTHNMPEGVSNFQGNEVITSYD